MGNKMKTTRLIVNICLIIGIILGVYFLQLSMTPEGYTGIFLWFKYNVHNSTNPLILLLACTAALLALNWNSIAKTRNKARMFGMVFLSGLILAGVFFFLNFKRHNRLPWNRPNVLLVVVDTLRADHVSAYGKDLAKTPNIDSLASEGWLFEQAYSHIPITLPSHSSLFTGRLPSDVWVMNNRDDFKYDEQTLAEILKENGYNTAAAISLGVLKKVFHIDRGFDHYDDRLPGNGQWFNRADVITNRGIEWLEENSDDEKPFFMWLHYSDPHEPYDPPGTPPDTEIMLNGQVVTQGSLDSASRVEAPMLLKPGKNEIIIKNIFGESIDPYFTQIYFSGDAAGIGPFPEIWEEQLTKPRQESPESFAITLRNLQSDGFLGGFNQLTYSGLKFQEGPGWNTPFYGDGRARRSIAAQASIVVYNESGKEMSLVFNVKGGINKPLEMVKKQYAGEVEYADQEIGRLLNYLKRKQLMDNTIVIVMADHGEELNEHGLIGHIHNLYTQSLQVPLIIYDPQTDHKGEKINKIARLIDVAPTILDMVGLHTPEYMQGRTLMEYILRNRSPERTLYSQTFTPEAKDNKFGILEMNELGIYTPDAEKLRQLELYDLNEDLMQWRNKALNPSNSGISSSKGRLAKYADSVKVDDGQKIVESLRNEMLNDLGYINTTSAPTKIDDLGYPSDEVIIKVREAMELLPLAANNPLRVEVKELGVSSSGTPLNYISVSLNLPEGSDETQVIDVQTHLKNVAMAQSRQFPVRLTVSSGKKLLLDKSFRGDNTQVVKYLTLRLFRLLAHQPFAAPVSTSVEGLYSRLIGDLENYLGVK